MRAAFAIALSALLPAALTARAQTNSPAPVHTIFSTSHRFAISGLSGVDAITLARWADDVAERVERALGSPIPFEAGEVIILRALPSARGIQPGAEISQGYFDGRLQQKMVIVRPADADQEDLLEGLCTLLVNRQLVSLQAPERRREQPVVAPAWLGVGLAQVLFHELRSRNAPAVLRLREEGHLPRVDDLLDWNVLPAGRWREKYCCGVFAGWLSAQADARDRWAGLLRTLAEGGDLRATLQKGVLRMADWPAVERGWERWVDQQQQVVRDIGRQAPRHLDELEAMMTLEPRALGVTSTNAPPRIEAAALIPRRKEGWVGTLASSAAFRTRLAAVGQPPEVAKAAESLAAFYDELARAARAKGFFSRGPSAASLQSRLEAAQGAFATLRGKLAEQDRYVDALDRWQSLQRDAAAPASPEAPALPDRAAVQRYLDTVEKTMPAAP